MRLKTFFAPVIIICLMMSVAYAETLQDRLTNLVVLPLHYGTNSFEVNGQAVLITKGDFNTETASGGDAYTVMVHENENGKPDDWKMVRYEGSPSSQKILTITAPHTGEDSIMSVRFMVSKDSPNGTASDLYLLKAEKIFPPKMKSLVGDNEVIFTLYKLWRSDDFGIFYFHQLMQNRSKTKYCNVDWVMFKELGVLLPDNSGQYECVTAQ